MVSIGIKN